MKTELMVITPEVAAQLLEWNTNNRPLNKTHVDFLVGQMLDGQWVQNGDPIRFSDERLIDGQHRLHAVIKSGFTIEAIVLWGVPDDAFTTIDVGRKRTGSDTFSTKGEANTTALAAALRIVNAYFKGDHNYATVVTNSDLLSLLDEHPTIRESVRLSKHTHGLLPSAMLAACHYLFSLKDKAKADAFHESLLKGSGLNEGDPVFTLRERLLKNSLSRSKLPKNYVFAIIVKSWNAYRAGKSIRMLKFRDGGDNAEPFPIVA